MAELRSVEEARAEILDRAHPLEAEEVAVGLAAGRVVAEPALAGIDLPPFRSSAMDGFAVRAADTPGSLPVSFRIAAGAPAPRSLRRGEAMAIATGGVVPDGADAVLPVEYVVQHDNTISTTEDVRVGAHVRERGGDVRAGETVLAPGTVLGPAHLGALAAVGLDTVQCARRPRAAVLTTGNELQAVGRALGPGQIYESNGVMLAAQLFSAGAQVETLPAVEDVSSAHRAALERGLGFDVLVTSGGVSVGPHDLVRAVAADLGVEEVFWGVAVKPGKPLAFGVRGQTLVFGLPGNPVSTLVSFELFVRPALLALQGAEDVGPHFRRGRVEGVLRRDSRRDQLLRARSRSADGETRLHPLAGQESHMIARAAAADALIHVPRGEGRIAAGSAVSYLPLS